MRLLTVAGAAVIVRAVLESVGRLSFSSRCATIDDHLQTTLLSQTTEQACILLHGYATTPLELLPLAQALQHDGFTTYSPWLPDHRGSPRALAVCRSETWAPALGSLIQEVQARHAVVTVVGQSIGGTLALRLASVHAFAGVVAINPYFRLRRYGTVVPESIAARIHGVIPYVPFLNVANGTRKLRADLAKGLALVPLAPLRGLRTLADETRNTVQSVQAPVLFVTSTHDRLVDPTSSDAFAEAIGHSAIERVFLERSGHMAVLDVEMHKCISAIRAFLYRTSVETRSTIATGMTATQ